MVLCEEILQWLTDCENYPSAVQASSRRVAHSIPLHRPESAVGDWQAATLHAAPVPANSLSANNAHGHTKSSREWTMLEQLSRELGKNLGDDGSRSSPLSPSDLAGAALQRARASCLCSYVLGPVSVSISPHALFQQHSTGRQRKVNPSNTGGGSSSKRNGKLSSAAAAPATTFSSSLGVKLKGSTGRSIDTWLQKHKKNQASTDISQAGQAFTPRGEPSLPQHRHNQKVQPQKLEAAVALQSKQVGVQCSAFKRRLTVFSRSQCLKNTTACWVDDVP